MSEKMTTWGGPGPSEYTPEDPAAKLARRIQAKKEEADWHMTWACDCKDKAHPQSEEQCSVCAKQSPFNK